MRRKAPPGTIARQAADDARLQIENEGVAEALVHESDSAVIGRDVGSLAEVGEDFDIRRQMFQRIARLALGYGRCGKQ